MGCFQNEESRARSDSSSVSGIRRVLRYSLQLYDFMVNDVLQGKVGDPREEVIDAATGGQPEIFDPAYTLYFEIVDHF